MNPFYKLNQTLNSIGAEKKEIAESKETVKSPARQTLEQALRQDLSALMEGQVNEISKDTKDSYAKKAKTELDIFNRNKNNPGASAKDKEVAAKSAAKREKGLEKVSEDGTGGMNFSGSGSLEENGEDNYHKIAEYEKHYMFANQIDALASEDVDAIATELGLSMEEVIECLYDLGLDPSADEEGLDEADYSAKKAAAGKDIGKPGKNFSKIAKSAGKKYGSKEAGERVAGAVLNKLRHPKESAEKAPMPSKGIPGNIPVPGKMDRLRGKRDYYEADNSEEDIMDYLNRKLAPHDKQQAKEDAVATPYNKGTSKPDAHNGMEFEGNAFTGKLKSTPKGGKFKLGDKEFTDTSELDEAVSRKHFQAIADTLKHIEDMEKRKELAQHHASAFKLANPRFDQNRFFKAAGITDEGIAGQAVGTLAGGALGGPVGAAIGGAIGNNLTGDGAVEEGFDDMDKWLAQREKEKGTGKFDKRKVSTGTVYTRRFDDEPADDDTDAPVSKGGAPRGRGRPAGTKRAIGAKHSGRSKLASKDAIAEEGTHNEVDQEHLNKILSAAYNTLEYSDSPYAEETLKHIIQAQRAWNNDSSLNEKSVSQAQAHMMSGAAHNPKFAKKVGVSQKVAKEFNKADKGKDISKLPKKVKKTEEGAKPDFLDLDKDGDKKEPMKKAAKEKKVDETTTSGSVAPTSAPKAKSNSMGIGQGIYDSWNREIESMISESVQVKTQVVEHMADGDEEAITITATGADVHRIKELLAAMGIEHETAGDGECCQACGSTPCGCNSSESELDEADAPVTQNSPDYPTNQEESDDALQYSGGLDGKKSTGQSTVPVLASQEERQVSEANSFLNLYKAFAKIVK